MGEAILSGDSIPEQRRRNRATVCGMKAAHSRFSPGGSLLIRGQADESGAPFDAAHKAVDEVGQTRSLEQVGCRWIVQRSSDSSKLLHRVESVEPTCKLKLELMESCTASLSLSLYSKVQAIVLLLLQDVQSRTEHSFPLARALVQRPRPPPTPTRPLLTLSPSDPNRQDPAGR